MKMSRMFRTPVLAATLGLMFCAAARAQEEKVATAGDDANAVQAELAAMKAEIQALRGELKQLKAEVAKVKAARPQRPPQRKPDTTIYKIDVGDSPIRGPVDAKVTIVEYVDFQCPFCTRETPVIKKEMADYPNDVRLVFKHYPLPFHKKAKPAHAATALALKQKGSEGFWQMHDLIVANSKKLDIADLRAHAETVGLDLAKFDEVMADTAKIDALLTKDMSDAAKYKVRGTPTVFINGLKLSPRGMANYKARIDTILKGGKGENKAEVE